MEKMTINESMLRIVGKRINLSKPRDQEEILRQLTKRPEFEIEIIGRLKELNQGLLPHPK